MRVAVVNWSRRKVGGVETYLGNVIPEMHRSKLELAFWSEVDVPHDRERIELPEGVPAFCASELGTRRALAALREWRPDLLYVHKVSQPGVEAKLLDIAPAVFFAHDYYGTCISGAKTFKNPQVIPCDRRFGWQCLLHYYPHRCGGLNPVTMLKLYRLQSRRLKLMHEYKAVVTHSEHLRREYLRHGLVPERVHNLLYYAHNTGETKGSPDVYGDMMSSLPGPIADVARHPSSEEKSESRLLFVGRMDFLKGGRTFLESLPQVSSALGRPLRVTFAGDGPDRNAWEREAARTLARCVDVTIDFTGWLDAARLNALWADCDLLVMPSLWPEPFGLVGVEAGLHNVPAAAFSVGGIPAWLVDGVNGYLAPGDPPTPDGLAVAIIKCLEDPATHARLRNNALKVARRFSINAHLIALLNIFEKILVAE